MKEMEFIKEIIDNGELSYTVNLSKNQVFNVYRYHYHNYILVKDKLKGIIVCLESDSLSVVYK